MVTSVTMGSESLERPILDAFVKSVSKKLYEDATAEFEKLIQPMRENLMKACEAAAAEMQPTIQSYVDVHGYQNIVKLIVTQIDVSKKKVVRETEFPK